MLFPKDVREQMERSQENFTASYLSILQKMQHVMEERGSVRDTDTPIYVRRSVGEQLGIAHGKFYRVQSCLDSLNHKAPRLDLLRKVIEECIDIANYVIFIAALCRLVLEQEENYAGSPHNSA